MSKIIKFLKKVWNLFTNKEIGKKDSIENLVMVSEPEPIIFAESEAEAEPISEQVFFHEMAKTKKIAKKKITPVKKLVVKKTIKKKK